MEGLAYTFGCGTCSRCKVNCMFVEWWKKWKKSGGTVEGFWCSPCCCYRWSRDFETLRDWTWTSKKHVYERAYKNKITLTNALKSMAKKFILKKFWHHFYEKLKKVIKTLRVRLIYVIKNWKLLFENIYENTCG